MVVYYFEGTMSHLRIYTDINSSSSVLHRGFTGFKRPVGESWQFRMSGIPAEAVMQEICYLDGPDWVMVI